MEFLSLPHAFDDIGVPSQPLQTRLRFWFSRDIDRYVHVPQTIQISVLKCPQVFPKSLNSFNPPLHVYREQGPSSPRAPLESARPSPSLVNLRSVPKLLRNLHWRSPLQAAPPFGQLSMSRHDSGQLWSPPQHRGIPNPTTPS